MSGKPSDEGFCLFCGYALRGLPTSVCPECGRAFDPANPRTFDRSQGKSIRRRRLRQAAGLVGCTLIVLAVAPRGCERAEIAFHCGRCGGDLVCVREELTLGFIKPFAGPGRHMEDFRPATPPYSKNGTCQPEAHQYSSIVLRQGPAPGMVRGTASWDPGRSVFYFNGRLVTPEEAGFILHDFLRSPGFVLHGAPIDSAGGTREPPRRIPVPEIDFEDSESPSPP